MYDILTIFKLHSKPNLFLAFKPLSEGSAYKLNQQLESTVKSRTKTIRADVSLQKSVSAVNN